MTLFGQLPSYAKNLIQKQIVVSYLLYLIIIYYPEFEINIFVKTRSKGST